MLTLITDTNEYTLNTIEKVVSKANELAAGKMTSFDLDCVKEDVYFGFMTRGQEGHLTVNMIKEWIKEEINN